MTANKLRVGISGYGIVGQRRHKYIDERNDMFVVAVCDKSLDVFKDLSVNISTYSDYKTMIDKESLDILFVCMTNDIASEVTIFGLNNGLHVMCEKPPGRYVSDIENVRKVESLYPNLKLMYGFNHRYHNSVMSALNILKKGELGAVINLRGVYGKAKLLTFDQGDWRSKRYIAGGGVLLDQGIHMGDLMRLFGGEFTNVYSFISNSFWMHDVEDNAYALMRTDDGTVAMLHSSATQWRHTFSLEVNLEKGSINLGGILTGSKSYGSETMTVAVSDPDNDHGDPEEITTHYNKDPSWEREISVFSDAIKNNKKIKNGGSLDALKTMELVYKIYTSDKDWNKKYMQDRSDE